MSSSEKIPPAADLLSRVCVSERISRVRKQPLILHADNGNAIRAATLDSRLEELGILTYFSRPRASNDNQYSATLFRTAKYRPGYPSSPFTSKVTACQWGRRLLIGTAIATATAGSSS